MPSSPPLTAREYYDSNPPFRHNAGDIWRDLPSYGLVGAGPITGVIITPACDLTNRKVETVTYLPIVPLLTYTSMIGFMPTILREVNRQLNAAKMEHLIDTTLGYVPPDPADLDAIAGILDEQLRTINNSKQPALSMQRALMGIELLKQVGNRDLRTSPLAPLRGLFGDKEWVEILRKIITNAYSLDVHFLPQDGQATDWSGVPTHSVVLFRYPMTAPIQLLDLSQDLSVANWTVEVERTSRYFPAASAFAGERPMKVSAIRPRFMADILTRYVSMHVRLGSPDFTRETVDSYINSVKGED